MFDHIGMIIAGKYRVHNMIGAGCFGCIMRGLNIRTKEEVAIKIESVNASTKLLKRETQIYVLLSKQSSTGFPTIKTFGKDADFYYMVMELLGLSLSSFKKEVNQELAIPLEVVVKIGVQMIDRIKILHSTGLIHRDIKPDNLLFGVGRHSHIVHLIDFGFCKSYLGEDGAHIECATGKSIVGTVNFISVHMHNRIESSRRDDLESIMYVLIYLHLPLTEWNQMFEEHKSEEEVKQNKMALMGLSSVPQCIKKATQYCAHLGFKEAPDYEKLKGILKENEYKDKNA